MQPGFFNPQGEDWIPRKFAELERQLTELRAANPFGLTGIKPRNGGTDFDGYVNINGPAKITGTLDLPAGIIGNDALASPVQHGSVGGSERSFPVTAAQTMRAVQTIAVPAGFTRATVLVVASASAINGSSGADFLYVAAYAGSGMGGDTYSYAGPNGGVASASASAIQTFTGLSGGTITVATAIRCQGATWPANASTSANTNAVVIFTR